SADQSNSTVKDKGCRTSDEQDQRKFCCFHFRQSCQHTQYIIRESRKNDCSSKHQIKFSAAVDLGHIFVVNVRCNQTFYKILSVSSGKIEINKRTYDNSDVTVQKRPEWAKHKNTGQAGHPSRDQRENHLCDLKKNKDQWRQYPCRP